MTPRTKHSAFSVELVLLLGIVTTYWIAVRGARADRAIAVAMFGAGLAVGFVGVRLRQCPLKSSRACALLVVGGNWILE